MHTLTTRQRAALADAAQGPLFQVAAHWRRQGRKTRYGARLIKELIGRGLLERGSTLVSATPMVRITSAGRAVLAGGTASEQSGRRRRPRRVDPYSEEARTSGYAPQDDTPSVRAWWIDQ